MTSKQVYAATYRMYRVQAALAAVKTQSRSLREAINTEHRIDPKAASAAHVSFSMRGLFNSQ